MVDKHVLRLHEAQCWSSLHPEENVQSTEASEYSGHSMHAAAEALAWSYMTAGRRNPANMPCSGYPLVMIAILSAPLQTQTCRAHHVWHVAHIMYGT